MAFKGKLLSDTVVYTLGNILTQIINFALLPIFSRYLNPAEFGIFYYTNTVQAFVLVLSTLSLNSFILRHYFDLRCESDRKRLFGSVFLFLLLSNIILLSAQFLLFPAAIRCIKLQIPFYPYFVLSVINTFLEFFCIFPQIYFRVIQKPWHFFIFTSSKTLLTVLLSLIFVVGFKWGILGRFIGITYLDVLFAIISILIVWRIATLTYDGSLIRKGMHFSLPLIPGAVAYIALGSVDRIILERFRPISELGLYSISATIGSVIGIITLGYYRAIEPEIYKLFGTGLLKSRMPSIQSTFLLLTVPLGCVLIAFSREIMQIFFSPSFHQGYILIPFFVVAAIFKGAQSIVASTLFALNKTKYDLIISLAGIGINVVLCLALIPPMGMFGAAAATIATSWIVYLIYVVIVRRLSSVSLHVQLITMTVIPASIGSLFSLRIHFNSITETIAIKIASISAIVCIIFMINKKLGLQYLTKENYTDKNDGR